MELISIPAHTRRRVVIALAAIASTWLVAHNLSIIGGDISQRALSSQSDIQKVNPSFMNAAMREFSIKPREALVAARVPRKYSNM